MHETLVFFSSYVHNFRDIGGLGAVRSEVLYYISGKSSSWFVWLETLMTLRVLMQMGKSIKCGGCIRPFTKIHEILLHHRSYGSKLLLTWVFLNVDHRLPEKNHHITHCPSKDKFIAYCRKGGFYIDRILVSSFSEGEVQRQNISNSWAVWFKASPFIKIMNGIEKTSWYNKLRRKVPKMIQSIPIYPILNFTYW